MGGRLAAVSQAARSWRWRKARGRPTLTLPEPGTVDYARSFFPVAFIVLVVRAFIFEPFRIPSDSMMPTLLDGDFIVVNKYAYGLRLPIVNRKFVDTGTPQRGDVVVFRYPPDPSTNYIKRLVGLPGDRVEIHDDHLIINGETDRAAGRRPLHRWLLCRPQAVDGNHRRTHAPGDVVPRPRWPDAGRQFQLLGQSGTAAGLRPQDRDASRPAAGSATSRTCRPRRDSGDHVFEIVPPGHYLMIGDNRDNSQDSRSWGLVPDANLVGKATRIWFNFDPGRGAMVNFKRIGEKIE